MVSFPEVIRVIICLIFTGLSYLVGLKFGEFKADLERPLPCPKAETTVQYITMVNGKELTPGQEIPKCEVNAATAGGKKVFDHCVASPYTDRTYLHHYPGIIPDEVFPWLHHPSLAAKSSLVLTESMTWHESSGGGKGDAKVLSDNCEQIYLTRTGSRSNQPNKCVAVVRTPEGVNSLVQNSHRYGFTALLTDQYQNDHARDTCFVEELQLLHPFLDELSRLKEQFLAKMGSPFVDGQSGERKTAIIMVANEGVVDLLLNFLCSAEQAQIDLNQIMVFVGSESDAQVIEAMGVHAMFAEALGAMPQHAAQGYLDTTFARMMWYKTTSVYLAVVAGFNVLFQDVDLVWMQDPIPYLKSQPADISFMDDGARTPRYTPFFVNSGFFFIKNNPRTVYFEEKMMKNAVAEIGYTHSHQSVLIKHLAETIHATGLKVLVLDMELFPSGQAYHEKKKYLAKVIAHTFKPYVFHMCWTDNRHNKVVYFKEVGLWYLPELPQCNTGKEMRKLIVSGDGAKMRNTCCQRQLYWKDA